MTGLNRIRFLTVSRQDRKLPVMFFILSVGLSLLGLSVILTADRLSFGGFRVLQTLQGEDQENHRHQARRHCSPQQQTNASRRDFRIAGSLRFNFRLLLLQLLLAHRSRFGLASTASFLFNFSTHTCLFALDRITLSATAA